MLSSFYRALRLRLMVNTIRHANRASISRHDRRRYRSSFVHSLRPVSLTVIVCNIASEWLSKAQKMVEWKQAMNPSIWHCLKLNAASEMCV